MKFSNKLFKNKAKISLPVFILMGSFCRLEAMEVVDENGMGTLCNLEAMDEVDENIILEPMEGMEKEKQLHRNRR